MCKLTLSRVVSYCILYCIHIGTLCIIISHVHFIFLYRGKWCCTDLDFVIVLLFWWKYIRCAYTYYRIIIFIYYYTPQMWSARRQTWRSSRIKKKKKRLYVIYYYYYYYIDGTDVVVIWWRGGKSLHVVEETTTATTIPIAGKSSECGDCPVQVARAYRHTLACTHTTDPTTLPHTRTRALTFFGGAKGGQCRPKSRGSLCVYSVHVEFDRYCAAAGDASAQAHAVTY